MPCPFHAHAALCRGLEKSLSEWHGHVTAGGGTACVNHMGKTHSKPLAERHGRAKSWARHGRGMGAAWERHGMCELAFNSSEVVTSSNLGFTVQNSSL
jgi:hypothetical protein